MQCSPRKVSRPSFCPRLGVRWFCRPTIWIEFLSNCPNGRSRQILRTCMPNDHTLKTTELFSVRTYRSLSVKFSRALSARKSRGRSGMNLTGIFGPTKQRAKLSGKFRSLSCEKRGEKIRNSKIALLLRPDVPATGVRNLKSAQSG